MVRTVSKVKESIKSPLGASTPRDVNKTHNRKRKSTSADKSNNDASHIRKKRRARPGTIALREIKYYQRETHRLIPRAPFSRIVKQIVTSYQNDLRMQTLAMDALHEASEAFLVRYLEESNLCALHAKRVTLQPKDMRLLGRIKYSSEKFSMTD